MTDRARWQEMFDGLMCRVGGRFARVEPRRRARALVLGLMSDLPSKNCWSLAEYAGDDHPAGMQHLLRQAVWDADALRDDVRALAVEQLGTDEALLVTAGRIENAHHRRRHPARRGPHRGASGDPTTAGRDHLSGTV